jgi:hypothetical protein
MNTAIALWLILFAAIAAIAMSGGVMAKAFYAFAFAAILIGITWFFYSRRAKPPTRFEIIAATAWLIIRRVVGIVGALLFFVVAVLFAFGLISGAGRLDTLTRIGYGIFLFAASAFCVWVAIYGQGWVRSDWKDDVALHRENKKRYHWRW